MLLFLVLFALWLLLNGRVTLELILIGAAVSGAVWLFCYRTLGYRPQRERVLLRRLPHYAHYAAALAAEIFKANLTVMRAILSGRPCRPAIRRVASFIRKWPVNWGCRRRCSATARTAVRARLWMAIVSAMSWGLSTSTPIRW